MCLDRDNWINVAATSPLYFSMLPHWKANFLQTGLAECPQIPQSVQVSIFRILSLKKLPSTEYKIDVFDRKHEISIFFNVLSQKGKPTRRKHTHTLQWTQPSKNLSQSPEMISLIWGNFSLCLGHLPMLEGGSILLPKNHGNIIHREPFFRLGLSKIQFKA